ncbi:hypothetical protein VB773_06370 [Haloarculaceae archaeon H-GB2-1]|nr:hypothetical protein [Haloarculaceae archaeon H-GB11]MEA5407231.1 hypothetical protein [Haloarculaceae archaeon H-GB2-1]
MSRQLLDDVEPDPVHVEQFDRPLCVAGRIGVVAPDSARRLRLDDHPRIVQRDADASVERRIREREVPEAEVQAAPVSTRTVTGRPSRLWARRPRV